MYSAIIIEPRIHYAFNLVLSNFLKNLDNNWNFIIFHSKYNEKYLKNLILSNFYNYKYRITLIELNINNLDLYKYSLIFTNPDFYNFIPTEIFLVFQLDTLCSDKYKYLINNFIKYDYSGAPWKNLNNKIGNGGLSLRKKSKMLEIIKNNKINLNEHFHEDIFFSNYEFLYKPPFEEAITFSVETVYNNKSFGIHKCWDYISHEELKNISKYIPDIYKLIDLQKNFIHIENNNFDINLVFNDPIYTTFNNNYYIFLAIIIIFIILILFIFYYINQK